jgi:hypothetical protein
VVKGDLDDAVDWPLYLIDVLGLLSLHHQGGADDLGGGLPQHKGTVSCWAPAKPGSGVWR